jgi:hypothetical protein
MNTENTIDQVENSFVSGPSLVEDPAERNICDDCQ